MVIISEESPFSADAINLIDELSRTLENITGNSGRGSFHLDDLKSKRALFVIARNQSGLAVGCGAVRPINEKIGEVKRMYAKNKGCGIGTKILAYLELKGRLMGFSEYWLETRKVNDKAVSFYVSKGYLYIPNYGKYIGNDEAVCFKKIL